ncbi:MAG TPA: carbon-nitrogen hydrolase family protein [Moraxellaceae bacterium]|nr:carbon-nitrogen hydrolase family protein [Moraxellaceae bacterium]
MRQLQVGIAQLPAVFGDVAGQVAVLEGLLNSHHADLVLLPELALSGYVSPRGNFDVTPFGEPPEGETLQQLCALARYHRVALGAPLVEQDGTYFYNSYFLIDREGTLVGHWRKRHPWYPEAWASPGNTGTPVVEFLGIKICAAICFDIHFVETDAWEALVAADLMLFPSAWVEEHDSRNDQLGALARRHGIAIANANWGAGAPFIPSQGLSMIFNARGDRVASTSPYSTTAWCEARLEFS